MTEHHPITPPAALVKELWDTDNPNYFVTHVSTEFARWGADQELKECCEWLKAEGYESDTIIDFRAARRPRPPSLNEVALQMLGTIERDAHYLPEITDTIRRALEALPE